jgi:hypothetical protein
MKGLKKSECAKAAGELTVVRLGYVTQLQEQAYAQGRRDEREEVKEWVKEAIYQAKGKTADEELARLLRTLSPSEEGKGK